MIENAYVAAVASNKTEIFLKVKDYCIGPSVRARVKTNGTSEIFKFVAMCKAMVRKLGLGTGGFRTTLASLSKNA